MNGPEPPTDPNVVNIARASLCLYVLDRIHAIEATTTDPDLRLQRAVRVLIESELLLRIGHELAPIHDALQSLVWAAAGESPFEEPVP